MAMISDMIADHFSTRDDLQQIVQDIDTGLYTVGLSVLSIRDMLLHGSPSSCGTNPNAEEVAAAAEGVLAFLGQLGLLIDKLEVAANPHRQPARAMRER